MKNWGTNNFWWGVKVAALILYLLVTIVTCAGVWNYCKEYFVIVGSVILLVINCTFAYLQARWLFKQPTGNLDK